MVHRGPLIGAGVVISIFDSLVVREQYRVGLRLLVMVLVGTPDGSESPKGLRLATPAGVVNGLSQY